MTPAAVKALRGFILGCKDVFKARCPGIEVSPKGGYAHHNINFRVCLLGMVREALKDEQEKASPGVFMNIHKLLGLTDVEARILEAGFCGWNFYKDGPSYDQQLWDLGEQLRPLLTD